MLSKIWAALGICAALMVGGISVVAAGNMNGDCLLTQDQLQLKDGTGENCTDPLAATDGTCDSCNDYNWSFLYGETDLESPHQSAVGQTEEYLLVALESDGVCDDPILNSYFYQFLFGETDLEPPYKAHAGQAIMV
jgi:hypothetical protein